MPIRPERRHLYPPRREWRAIRGRILVRAGDRCEQCGVPNHHRIRRIAQPPGFLEHDGCSRCLGGEDCGAVEIVLTIAHLDHDPTNNLEENLRALCQRCHLRHDAEEHRRNAAETRARKRQAETGQLGIRWGRP